MLIARLLISPMLLLLTNFTSNNMGRYARAFAIAHRPIVFNFHKKIETRSYHFSSTLLFSRDSDNKKNDYIDAEIVSEKKFEIKRASKEPENSSIFGLVANSAKSAINGISKFFQERGRKMDERSLTQTRSRNRYNLQRDWNHGWNCWKSAEISR